MHQISWEDASRPCREDHVTKSPNRKLIRVTSSDKGLKHMCVDLSDYNRYLNQISYRTQIPHYQIHINWKCSRHLEFRKNGSRLDKDILHQIIWEDASRPCGDDHVTNSQNRKLIRVTSWTKGFKHNFLCASISVTITNIWTKFGTEHKHHTTNTPEWPNSHFTVIQDGGRRHLELR